MKLKTQLITGVMAAVLALGSTMCVYANPSVTAVASTDHKDQYETGKVEDMADYDALCEEKPVVIDAIKEVNNSKDKSTAKFADAIMKDADEKTAASAREVSEVLKKSEFLTDFFDVYVKDNKYKSNKYLRNEDNIDVARTANGNFRVTLKVPSLTRNNKNVRVIHYRKAVGENEKDWSTGEWEIIVPLEIDYEKKEIVVEFRDFSPAAILAAVTVDDSADTAVDTPAATKPQEQQETPRKTENADKKTDKKTDSGKSSGKKSSSGSSSSSSSKAKSPKTGMEDTFVIWFAAGLVLASCAVITTKRHR